MWPYIVPQSVTIWQAAAPEKSQIFMLFGVAVMIPIILAYTAFAYWVFRGKVHADAGLPLMVGRARNQAVPGFAAGVVCGALARGRRHGRSGRLRNQTFHHLMRLN